MNAKSDSADSGIPVIVKLSAGGGSPFPGTWRSKPIPMVGDVATLGCTLVAKSASARLEFAIEISYDHGHTWETPARTHTLTRRGYGTTTIVSDRAGLVRARFDLSGSTLDAKVDGSFAFVKR